MNVELLRKIAAVIQEKPLQFDMSMWHIAEDGREFCSLKSQEAKDCGTAHCIGGWAHILTPDLAATMFTADAGAKALGISDEQANRLFYTSAWPKKFAGKYRDLKTDRAKARVAAARIEHFIATDGRE